MKFRAIPNNKLIIKRNNAFPKRLNIAGKIKKQALDIGLICYPMQGTADGVEGDHILIAPPFIINEDEINELSTKLKSTIDLVCNQV